MKGPPPNKLPPNYLQVCLDWLMRPASEVIGTDFFLRFKVIRFKTTAMMFLHNYSAFELFGVLFMK